MSSGNRKAYVSFLVWMCLTSAACPSARRGRAALCGIRVGRVGVCLVDLTGKVFVFYSLLNMMLAMGFYLFMGFVTLREFPFISSIFFKS